MSGVNAVQAFNVHTIAIQVPISDLTRDGRRRPTRRRQKSVIGVWATASRRKSRIFDPTSGKYVGHGPGSRSRGSATRCSTRSSSRWPRRTSGTPGRRARTRGTRKYVNKPELAGLLPVLYPGVVPQPGGVQQAAGRPQRDPDDRDPGGRRARVPELHRPVQADMLRLNVAIPPTASPNPLGLVAGDAAGFPNGRRLDDDVVTIELRAVAGLTIPLVDPSFTPDGAASAVTDGTTNTNAALLHDRSPTSACRAADTRRCRARRRRLMSQRGAMENPYAGQGSVLLDIGGDVGALVVTMPAAMVGEESRSRLADRAREGMPHGGHHRPHVAVVTRPGRRAARCRRLVFPELVEGSYALVPEGHRRRPAPVVESAGERSRRPPGRADAGRPSRGRPAGGLDRCGGGPAPRSPVGRRRSDLAVRAGRSLDGAGDPAGGRGSSRRT